MEAALNNLITKIDALGKRLDGIEAKLANGVPAGAPAAAAPANASAAKKEFDDLIEEHLVPLVAKTTFSDVVKEQLNLMIEVARDISAFIGMAAASKKPSANDLPKLLAPISEKMAKVSEYANKNRADKYFNNISAIAELSPCFGWIAVEPTPAPFIGDTIPSGEFYTNRILMANKGKDQAQCDWSKGLISFFKEMQQYVKRVHTTGLVWNPKGAEATAPAAAKPAEAAKPAATKPAAAKPAASGDAKNALFASLNSANLTKNLTHVRDDQKNKNMTAEQKQALAAKVQPKKAPAPARNALKPKGDPVLELRGAKWMVENQFQKYDCTIDDTEKNHVVFATGNVQSGLTVKGKINAITIDNCKKSSFVIDDVVSAIEVINSNDIKLQINGVAPSINIDKCDGVQVFIQDECAKNVQFYTSKTSSICVSVPGATPEDDPVEHPIPEQFISSFKDKKLTTIEASHV